MPACVLSVDDVEAGVGHEGGRNLDAVGRLVVLQQGGYDTRQRQG